MRFALFLAMPRKWQRKPTKKGRIEFEVHSKTDCNGYTLIKQSTHISFPCT